MYIYICILLSAPDIFGHVGWKVRRLQMNPCVGHSRESIIGLHHPQKGLETQLRFQDRPGWGWGGCLNMLLYRHIARYGLHHPQKGLETQLRFQSRPGWEWGG